MVGMLGSGSKSDCLVSSNISVQGTVGNREEGGEGSRGGYIAKGYCIQCALGHATYGARPAAPNRVEVEVEFLVDGEEFPASGGGSRVAGNRVIVSTHNHEAISADYVHECSRVNGFQNVSDGWEDCCALGLRHLVLNNQKGCNANGPRGTCGYNTFDKGAQHPNTLALPFGEAIAFRDDVEVGNGTSGVGDVIGAVNIGKLHLLLLRKLWSPDGVVSDAS